MAELMAVKRAGEEKVHGRSMAYFLHDCFIDMCTRHGGFSA